MKNISKSVAMIAAVAAIAIGGTIAYFSDTETSTGNTLTAGTIDIAIDGQNPWTTNYHLPDLKPGETGNINFNIQNVGTNPVNVSKKISNFVESTGTESEPECAAEHNKDGCWDNNAKACDWNSSGCVGAGARKDDIQTQIIYDLSVKVYTASNSTTPIWWQSIYTDAEGKKLSEVYPSGSDTSVALGMIPVGGHMIVTQSYHFNKDAGNEYQGDQLAFDITIKGDQLPQGDDGMTTVSLENKVQGTGDVWDIVEGDSIEGTLNYKNQGSKFDYNFTGKVKTTGNYTLLYVGSTNNYPCTGSVVLGTGAFTAGSDGTLSGQITTGSITNGKIWLIPNSSYSGGVMTSWPAADILFETGLINYTQN
jgi:predicted ribosomally synthesized peptide with SipW-like signal peptide